MVIIKECVHLRMSAAVLQAQVGSVIRNPEVSVLVPTLLAAITDPGKHTRATLEVRPVVEENYIDSSTPLMAMVFFAQPIRPAGRSSLRCAVKAQAAANTRMGLAAFTSPWMTMQLIMLALACPSQNAP